MVMKMRLPKNQTKVLNFKHNDIWYQITSTNVGGALTYTIYRQEDKNDYEKLATGQNPQKLEFKVYEGKLK